MKNFDVFGNLSLCKKLESKLILLVYSLILGHVLFFNLKQKKPYLVWGENVILFPNS